MMTSQEKDPLFWQALEDLAVGIVIFILFLLVGLLSSDHAHSMPSKVSDIPALVAAEAPTATKKPCRRKVFARKGAESLFLNRH